MAYQTTIKGPPGQFDYGLAFQRARCYHCNTYFILKRIWGYYLMSLVDHRKVYKFDSTCAIRYDKWCIDSDELD